MFPVFGVKDLDNSLVDEEFLIDDDLTSFMVARERDHLMSAISSTCVVGEGILGVQLMSFFQYALDESLLIHSGQGRDPQFLPTCD